MWLLQVRHVLFAQGSISRCSLVPRYVFCIFFVALFHFLFLWFRMWCLGQLFSLFQVFFCSGFKVGHLRQRAIYGGGSAVCHLLFPPLFPSAFFGFHVCSLYVMRMMWRLLLGLTLRGIWWRLLGCGGLPVWFDVCVVACLCVWVLKLPIGAFLFVQVFSPGIAADVIPCIHFWRYHGHVVCVFLEYMICVFCFFVSHGGGAFCFCMLITLSGFMLAIVSVLSPVSFAMVDRRVLVAV